MKANNFEDLFTATFQESSNILKKKTMTILAQISDLHIVQHGETLSRIIDTATHLKKAVARINHLTPQPDAVLITGDLTNDGTEEQYQHLRELLAPLKVPFYVIPGNHDDREAMRAA